MKASTPSLILFFVACVLCVFFRIFNHEIIELYCRSAIIPSLFIYYLVNNNYKITFYKIIIFFVLFVRDVLVVLKIQETALGSFICVLFVYLLLLYSAILEFRRINFNKDDVFTFLIIILGIGTLCFSILNLKFENLELDFFLYVIFGLVLSLLAIFSILNYIKIGSDAFFKALLMCVCYILSDVFFVIFKFYFYNQAFAMISLITQFLSYFFMTIYFLEKDKVTSVLDEN